MRDLRSRFGALLALTALALVALPRPTEAAGANIVWVSFHTVDRMA